MGGGGLQPQPALNQMQQTNVDHADHTVRALRRVRVDDESDAMDEQRKIRRQARRRPALCFVRLPTEKSRGHPPPIAQRTRIFPGGGMLQHS